MLRCPRLILAGLSGGSGKTLVSLGLSRFFRTDGLNVRPFKKGPDYIDATWLSLAAGQAASNLDPFLMPDDQVRGLFVHRARQADLAIIEGNRGLFDGKDVSGSYSTAELSKLLKSPVILVVDCTKMTRTIAAIVQGCTTFDPEVPVAGVILNQTAGERHRNILKNCVQTYTDVPVIGALPKLKKNPIPERYMGLISSHEYDVEDGLDELGRIMEQWLDVALIRDIADQAGELPEDDKLKWPRQVVHDDRVKIGVVRDAALWFYYEENIEALERAGAEIVDVTLFSKQEWPKLHGLYLGGGFPETQAVQLSENKLTRSIVKAMADDGVPIYAECGGLMYLGQSIKCDDKEFPMAGVFPFSTNLCPKPQGHGYTRVKVLKDNPFHACETTFTGHEFHYSSFSSPDNQPIDFALHMQRGKGIKDSMDGLVYKNTFATYTHMHAFGKPEWAERFVSAAKRFKEGQK